jgi:hypothetical protein
VEIEIVSPDGTSLPLETTLQMDGSVSVKYMPLIEGKHNISVKRRGLLSEGHGCSSMTLVSGIRKIFDVDATILTSPQMAIDVISSRTNHCIREKSTFGFRFVNSQTGDPIPTSKDSNFSVSVTSQSGEVPVSIDVLEDGSIDVIYVPQTEGDFFVRVQRDNASSEFSLCSVNVEMEELPGIYNYAIFSK